MEDAGAQGGVGDIKGVSGFEALGGNAVDLIVLGMGAVNENQFIFTDCLGIVCASVFGYGHLALDGEQVGEEFTDDEEHEPEVDCVEPEFGGFEGEASGVGNREVDKHESTDGVASEHWNTEPGELISGRPDSGVLPGNDKAFEVEFLGVPDAVLNLIDGAKEDKHHGGAEQDDGQLEGAENL